MNRALDADGLKKNFGATAAVRDLTFHVDPGEIVGLVGPDGAGKTTSMRMIMGLISPNSGRVSVLGHDVSKELSSIRSLVGYMPQQFSLYSDLTVEENLRFFAGMYGVSAEQLAARETRLFGIARLEEFRDRPAGALSGGMYKKLALSCALIHEPRLLVLDEPTNGVDPISRRELWSLLKERVKNEISVLISTPYMDEAQRCDRVALMVGGRLVAIDSPDHLINTFSGTILELSTLRTFSDMSLLSRIPGVEHVYTMGKKLHIVCANAEKVKAPLFDALARANVGPVELNIVPASFEDVFMGLTSDPDSDETLA